MNARRFCIARPISSLCRMSPASLDVSTRSWTSVSIRREQRDLVLGQLVGAEQPGPDRVVDVVVDVGDTVDEAHDLAFKRRRLPGAGVVKDAVPRLDREVEPAAVALEELDYAERLLVVAEAPPEALRQDLVERGLARVSEGRVAEVVADRDRLRQVLVEAKRSRDRARDPGGLERMRQ